MEASRKRSFFLEDADDCSIQSSVEFTDIIVEPDIDDKITIKRKCGEVFYAGRNGFIFTCFICGSESVKLECYLEHLSEHDLDSLLIDENDSQTKTVNTLSSDLEEEQEESCEPFPAKYQEERLAKSSNNSYEDNNFEDVAEGTIKLEMEVLDSSFIEENIKLEPESSSYGKIAEEEYTYVCPVCSKTFSDLKKFKAHQRRHKSSRDLACEMCDAVFADASNLKVHINRHLGIKPHSCDLCTKSFTSSTELKIHKRSHTGERPYMCDTCGQSYTNSAHLTAHQRRHRNERRFVCPICGKKFFDKKSLRDHEVVHNDSRPHVCETCNAAFPRRKTLLEHTKLHSGIKQHVCKACGKTFAQFAGMYSHFKNRHGTLSRK